MKDDFNFFIQALKEKLSLPLPGFLSQQKLEPASRRQYPSDPDLSKAKQSSVLAMFFNENRQTKLIFIQRPMYDGVHSGQIAFPGGQMEDTDGTAQNTALRETFEEIGVPESEIIIIGQLSQLYIPPSNFIVFPFVGYTTNIPKFYPDPSEVAEVFAININDLLKDEVILTREVKGKGYTLEVPCYFVNDRIIWGATSMILSELVDLIKMI